MCGQHGGWFVCHAVGFGGIDEFCLFSTKKDSKGKNQGWEDLQVKKVMGINKPSINKNKS